ncbi:MAG: AAA family ATPase [Luteibaculaceae bacterium]
MIKERLTLLTQALCKGIYEREEAVKLALLATIAGESIFLLGEPGVGKSLIARRLKFAFKEGKTFEYLMTRFSTPDEVFGPVSISKLKNEDKYERLTDFYLPGASIVFLDEIWKSGSAIQNALLTVLNERVYRNGEQEIDVKVKGIITASNETPPDKDSFGPLWDRLLIRYPMQPISKAKNFIKMITDVGGDKEPIIDENLQISDTELAEWSKQIDAIEVPEEVVNTIQMVRFKIEQYNEKAPAEPVKIFDRRWKKIIRLLRTSAFLNQRNYVNLTDCFIMAWCLWNKPNQLEAVKEIVAETIRKHGYSLKINLKAIKSEIESFEHEVEEEITVHAPETKPTLTAINDEYFRLIKDSDLFDGTLITVKDFNKLKTTEFEVVNLYNEELKLVNRINGKKAGVENAVVLKYNDVNYTFPLQTHMAQITKKILRSPHPLIKKYWDEKFNNINEYIFNQQQWIKEEMPNQLIDGAGNLFIESGLEKIVNKNLEEVKQSLNELSIALEQVKFSYEKAETISA